MKRIVNFERILCPVAQSHEADEGLKYAIALARSYGASLFVLTCVEESSAIDVESVAAIRAAINRAVEHSFVSFRAIGPIPLAWELIVAESNRPAELIKQQAETLDVDLIVMGSRHRPYGAALIGSTAEAVCRTGPCPVLVTRLARNRHVAPAIGDFEFKKLLVASDFSSDSELALRYGLSLAQEHRSQVHLLHVLTNSKTADEDIAWTSPSAEGAYHEAARKLHQSVPAEAHLWCEVKHSIREGRAYREIISYAVEQEIDLICIGAHGQRFRLGTLFGSNADRVLRESPCPVLLARSLKPGAMPTTG